MQVAKGFIVLVSFWLFLSSPTPRRPSHSLAKQTHELKKNKEGKKRKKKKNTYTFSQLNNG